MVNKAYQDIDFDYEYTKEELIIALKPNLIIKTCCNHIQKVTKDCTFYDYTHNDITLNGLGWDSGYRILGCKNCIDVNTGNTKQPSIFDIKNKVKREISCGICGKIINNYELCESCEGFGRIKAGNTIYDCSLCGGKGSVKIKGDTPDEDE